MSRDNRGRRWSEDGGQPRPRRAGAGGLSPNRAPGPGPDNGRVHRRNSIADTRPHRRRNSNGSVDSRCVRHAWHARHGVDGSNAFTGTMHERSEFRIGFLTDTLGRKTIYELASLKYYCYFAAHSDQVSISCARDNPP